MESPPLLGGEVFYLSSFPSEEEGEYLLDLSLPLEGEPGGEDDFLLAEEVVFTDEPFAFPSSFGSFLTGEDYLGDLLASVLDFTGSGGCLALSSSTRTLEVAGPPFKERGGSSDCPPSLLGRRNDRSRQVSPVIE